MIFWDSATNVPIVARIAIAGDFLPPCPQANRNSRDTPGQGWAELAAPLAAYFQDIDVSIVNCEFTIGTADLAPYPICGLGTHLSAPAASLDYLARIRAAVLGIANNHIYDFGPAGVERTRLAIKQSGLIPIGAGNSLQTAPEVFVWRGPGKIRIGFWAAARVTRHPSTRTESGVEPATVARARDALLAMRLHGTRFCVALLHAGCERTNFPDPEDLHLIRDLARSGFDLVAASHSHRISGASILSDADYSPAFCFHGLGSIANGLAASAAEREGLIVVAAFDAAGSLVRVELRPVLIAESGFGAIPPPDVGEAISLRFQVLSNEIADGSYARLFYRDMSRGLLRLYARDTRQAWHEAGMRGLARKAMRLRMRHARRLAHKVLA